MKKKNKKNENEYLQSRSLMSEVFGRFLKNKLAVAGIIFIAILILISIFADVFIDYEGVVIKQDIANRLQKPSLTSGHLLGTDEIGRDVLARLLYATRYSLLLSFCANLVGLIVGGAIGVWAGLSKKLVDTVLMRFVDILLAIPAVLFAIAIVSSFGCSIPNIIIALAITSVPKYARIMRSSVLSVKEMEYVEAARAIGGRTGRIIFSHILPNCLSAILVNVTLQMATLIMSTSILSFLGLGIPAPIPEWGGMLSAGNDYIRNQQYLTLFPGIAITLTIIAFNISGDGLRDALDPKLKYSLTMKERLALMRKQNKLSKHPVAKIEDDSGVMLKIEDLCVEYKTDAGAVKAVNNLNLEIPKGRVLGLVGETGAGKTTTALSILNMVRTPPGTITNGTITLDGTSILDTNQTEMSTIRGKEVSMIFQDPMTALNPTQTVADQIAEVIEHHENCSSKQAYNKALDMLELVGIRRERGKDYPHQFSGGMKQRVVIAIALACNPKLLIADEPTTALDVTIQAQILEKMKELQKKYQMSLLMITHDLGIIAETCEYVSIIYAGTIVESGTVEDIFNHTLHPYTKGLFDALPNVADRKAELKPIKGRMVDPTKLPAGCAFCNRCEYATEKCKTVRPVQIYRTDGHYVACHLYNKDNVKEGRAF